MTSEEPTAKQALAIFRLVFGRIEEDRRPSLTTFGKRGIAAKERAKLENDGHIKCEKVGRASRVVVTERGREWAASHLDCVLPKHSQQGTRVLEAVLRALGPFLVQRGATLAELVAGSVAEGNAKSDPRSTTPPVAAKKTPTGDLAARVRAASLALGEGRSGNRVRLSDVRRELPDVGREELDRVLLDLQRQEKLVLYRIDDPTDIQPEDEQAALMVAGYPRHILYLEQ